MQQRSAHQHDYLSQKCLGERGEKHNVNSLDFTRGVSLAAEDLTWVPLPQKGADYLSERAQAEAEAVRSYCRYAVLCSVPSLSLFQDLRWFPKMALSSSRLLLVPSLCFTSRGWPVLQVPRISGLDLLLPSKVFSFLLWLKFVQFQQIQQNRGKP